MAKIVDLTQEKDTFAELQRVNLELEGIYLQIEELQAEAAHLSEYHKTLKDQLEADKKQQQQEDQQRDWSSSFPWDEEVQQTLQSTFQLSQLRPLQKESINAALSKKDCLLVLPTGGGKSLCYQLVGLLSNGLTLVISPLVALMGDQVGNLTRLNINACFLSKDTPRDQSAALFRDLKSGDVQTRFLYVSPEKLLLSKQLTTALEATFKNNQLAQIVIDEVHCCSQWGHDFRPDYLKLGVLKQRFSSVPLFACTATADVSVRRDVKRILRMEGCLEVVGPLNRPNLFFEVKEKAKKDGDVYEQISNFILANYPQGSGIVYCLSQANSQAVAEQLGRRNIRAEAYHAALTKETREGVYSRWKMGRTKVVCATIAFGMGIDKGDVRFVVHHCLPKSLAAYYQECGRVGRDGNTATCLLYFSPDDIGRVLRVVGYSSIAKKKFCEVVSYGLNVSTCRREFLLQALGDKTESPCEETCDICKTPQKTEEVDVTQAAKAAVAIARASVAKDKKGLTIKQFLTIWNSAVKMKNMKIDVDPGDCFGIEKPVFLAHLFVLNILTEQLIDTSMSSNVYFIPGPAVRRVEAAPIFLKKIAEEQGKGIAKGKGKVEEEKKRKRKVDGGEERDGKRGKLEKDLSSGEEEGIWEKKRLKVRGVKTIVLSDSDEDW